MNILGIGTDIVSKKRISETNVFNEFLNKDELELYGVLKGEDKNDFLSGRWAAKESIIKASDKQITYKQISILKYHTGKPKILIDGKIREDIMVSISHEKDYTIAFSIIVNV